MSLRYVYRIDGPSGVYIGSTANPVRRWKAHLARSAPASMPRHGDLLINTLMRADGREHYTFAVVACTKGNGDALEYALVRRLRREGLRVLNVFPRLPQHQPPCRGGRAGLVVRGRVERLALPDPQAPSGAHVFGARLRNMREAAGLSRIALSQKIATDTSVIYRWEKGHSKPTSALVIAALARVFGMTFEAFYAAAFLPPSEQKAGA